MLKTLEEIFKTFQIETPAKEIVKVHSHTPKEQGFFLQEMFDIAKPKKSVEVGLAYGISTLFILEKHREYKNASPCHIVIEPFPWGGVAEYNIEKENLSDLVEIKYKKSHDVLPQLYFDGHHIQFAYVDTTKVFDIVLQDFYFIDKILDVNGVIILDDCGGSWPGVQRVARFINSLPHYEVLKGHKKVKKSFKRRIVGEIVSKLIQLIPFKDKFYSSISFKSDSQLKLDYSCIAFRKITEDSRSWDFDSKF